MKEFFTTELTTHQIGFIFCAIAALQIGALWAFNGKSIYVGARGSDGIWQLIEVLGITVLIIWPCMVLSDHFFGFRGSNEAWNSVNIAMAVAVLGISYRSYLKHSKPVNETTVEENRKTTITTAEKKEDQTITL